MDFLDEHVFPVEPIYAAYWADDDFQKPITSNCPFLQIKGDEHLKKLKIYIKKNLVIEKLNSLKFYKIIRIYFKIKLLPFLIKTDNALEINMY